VSAEDHAQHRFQQELAMTIGNHLANRVRSRLMAAWPCRHAPIILACLVAGLSTSRVERAWSADPLRRPNIVVILADDKYDVPGQEA
jgi:hypothetical protein